MGHLVSCDDFSARSYGEL